MTDITPSIEVDDFGNGRISFRVDAGDCSDTAGRFEYVVTYEDAQGNVREDERRQDWTRTHNKSEFYVDDRFTLGEIKSVKVVRGSIEAQCYSGEVGGG